MLKKVYSLLKNGVFDLLFPRFCTGCGVEGSWICSECLKKIDIIKNPFCPECRRLTHIGEFCDACKNEFFLDGILICANFGDGVLKEAIHQFKYEFISDTGDILGKIMAGKIISVLSSKYHVLWGDGLEFDFIIPVPLHEKRKRWRGFNQAELLAKKISDSLKIKTKYNVLVRKINTVPQMELDREERLKNLRDVFNVETNDYSSLRNKNILLVDDVTTTGATLEECAKLLKNNGAKNVWGIVLAKGK
uniref:ComF family protein n=1 Tax=candidate division CPR3 bacterium TaxID=2268181 RepID=A0A7C4LZP2_UNCC3